MLTTREQEVLRLVMAGRTNKELAEALCICEKTVEFHLANVFRKLDVGSRTELAVKAIRDGLVEGNSNLTPGGIGHSLGSDPSGRDL